ncbi:uncharacterized protein GBIM_06820 [Gryllus bimaculatus]|nr:uncharacterized protein GBIM_06820 [Gryllus bimaculatus]
MEIKFLLGKRVLCEDVLLAGADGRKRLTASRTTSSPPPALTAVLTPPPVCLAVTKFIRIGIADKNDNPPYFDKALYEAEVDENEDIQHTVLTVTAKDHDECEYHSLLACLLLLRKENRQTIDVTNVLFCNISL